MLKLIVALLIVLPFVANAESDSEKEAIRRVIRTHLREVKACYKDALNKKTADERIEGKIVVGWEFDKEGTVTKSWVVEKSTTLKNDELKNCIVEKVNSWKFAANAAGKPTVIDAYPFLLKMEDAAKP